MGSKSADYSGALSANNQAQQEYLNTVLRQQPNVYDPDLNNLRKLATDYAVLNTLDSRAMERQFNPNVALAREELQRQIMEDLRSGGELGAGSRPGDIENVLQRSAINAGLDDVLSSGVGLRGTAGRSRVARVLGENILNFRQNLQDRASQFLNQNPMPEAGINAGDLTGLGIDLGTQKANIFNQDRANKNALVAQNISDSNRAIQNAMAISAQQASEKNRGLAGLIGAGIGAVGTALGGPFGGVAARGIQSIFNRKRS